VAAVAADRAGWTRVLRPRRLHQLPRPGLPIGTASIGTARTGVERPPRNTAMRIGFFRAANPGRGAVSIFQHLERGRESPSNASHMRGDLSGTLRPRRHSAIFSLTGTFKCLLRILLCAWSTRQRTFFLIRRAPCFALSQAMSTRCRASGLALLSRTGSSSYAIRASGTSAFVDPLTKSSAIDRIRDDAR